MESGAHHTVQYSVRAQMSDLFVGGEKDELAYGSVAIYRLEPKR
jgi:hypothetical protein